MRNISPGQLIIDTFLIIEKKSFVVFFDLNLIEVTCFMTLTNWESNEI